MQQNQTRQFKVSQIQTKAMIRLCTLRIRVSVIIEVAAAACIKVGNRQRFHPQSQEDTEPVTDVIRQSKEQ